MLNVVGVLGIIIKMGVISLVTVSLAGGIIHIRAERIHVKS